MNPVDGMGLRYDVMETLIGEGVPAPRDRDIFAERMTREFPPIPAVPSRRSTTPISVLAIPVRADVAPVGSVTRNPGLRESPSGRPVSRPGPAAEHIRRPRQQEPARCTIAVHCSLYGRE